MSYKKYYLRAPTLQALKQDVKTVLQEEGIDPFERGVLKTGPNGEELFGSGYYSVESGQWFLTRPDPGTDASDGTRADYALLNVNTKDETLQSLIEQFDASSPSKEPSEVANSEKIGNGTHRITRPGTPWADFL